MIHFQNDQVTVFQSAIQKTNSMVIETIDTVFVIDPTWLPREVDEIRQWANQRRVGRRLVLIFTHSDFDHVLGYGAFREGKVIASRRLRVHPDKDGVLHQIKDWDNKNYVQRSYDVQFPRVDIAIEHNDQTISVESNTLTFTQTPGHNSDGMFTLFDDLGIMLAGDYLSDFEKPFLNHGYDEYLQSLEKARHWINNGRVKLLIPGHGEVTADVSEMTRRVDSGVEYLKRLEKAIREKNEEGMRQIGDEMPFPSEFTKAAHETNVRLIRAEIEGKL